MLSRVAESMYWLSRYIERAENVARFIDATYQMMLDLPAGDEQWAPLVKASGDYQPFIERYRLASRENVIRFLAFDEQNPNAILSCLRAARENARTVREYISSEMWQQVNSFYLMVQDAARSGGQVPPAEFFLQITQASLTFVGVTEGTMMHGEGWNFGRLGRMLERADKTSRILDVKYFILLPSVGYIGSTYDNILWAALLRSTSAFEMYRKRYGRINPHRVVEFLVLDSQFPRAMHHGLIQANSALHQITGTPQGRYANPAEKRLGRLLADVDYIDVEDIMTDGLHEFLDRTQLQINDVGNAIQQTFFELRPLAPPTEIATQE